MNKGGRGAGLEELLATVSLTQIYAPTSYGIALVKAHAKAAIARE